MKSGILKKVTSFRKPSLSAYLVLVTTALKLPWHLVHPLNTYPKVS